MARRRRPFARGWENRVIYAIGHSTLSTDELLERLLGHGVRTLADIRTVPRSRTNPQFNPDRLAPALARVGIRHVHLAALGGLRRPRPDSPNAGWRNLSFRGYANQMQTDAFAEGLEQLRRAAAEGPVAIMCAEALRWRCHRSLVADALFARGVVVRHVSSPTRAAPHVPTPFARYRGLRVTYPLAAAEAVAERARPATPRGSLPSGESVALR